MKITVINFKIELKRMKVHKIFSVNKCFNKWKFDWFTDKGNSIARCRKSPIEVDEIDAEDEQVDETDNDLSTRFRRQEERGQCQQRNHFNSNFRNIQLNYINYSTIYCSCGEAETVEHFLFECRKFSSQRIYLTNCCRTKLKCWPPPLDLLVSSRIAFRNFRNYIMSSKHLNFNRL